MQRHLRLRRREDFAYLRKHSKVQRHPFLILSVTPNQFPHNRYGFITNKQLGKAVDRNRIRRLLREAVRQADSHLHEGYDIAFIARKHIVGQPYQAVEDAVKQCLIDAGLWTEVPGDIPP